MAYSDTLHPLKSYLREIGETKLLTPAEEVKLARLIQRGKKAEKQLSLLLTPRVKKTARAAAKPAPKAKAAQSEKLRVDIEQGAVARQKMISANLRLVVKIAQDYANFGVPLMDLISEGNIGLTKAVDRFEPRKGAKLSTYAAWWIKQAVRRALSDQGKTIRLPVHLADKISKMRRLSTQLTEEFGREPTDDELAEEMSMSTSKLARLRTAALHPASLNAPVGEDGDSVELGDLVRDETARRPDHLVENLELTKAMFKMMSILDERERMILTLRYGLDGSPALTLEEVGERFSVTRERIRQLQNLGLKKLGRALTVPGAVVLED